MRGQAHRLRSFLPVILFTCPLPLIGCIRNQIYRPYPDSAIVVPPPAPIEIAPHKARAKVKPDELCDHDKVAQAPCLAFLEFDDLGEPWERSVHGRPSQLSRAVDLIEKARKMDPATLVLVFVHGWKHNAAGSDKEPEDTNITGFKAVLWRIHQEYQHPVLGVYVAWRGGLVSPDWPVAQQFSYFNREAAAIRVGNTSLTDALVELSDAVHGGPPPVSESSRSRIVMIGHSFGALVLERALSQATIMYLEKQYEDQNLSGSPETSTSEKAAVSRLCGYPEAVITNPLADMTVFVNSAAGANESKQMMDYLASSHFTYQTAQGPQPLFLSVTSKTDTATGVIFKIGHGASWLGYWATGSMRPKGQAPANPNEPSSSYSRACYDTMIDKNKERLFDMSQTSFYMTTTAHSPQLQSHTVEEIVLHGTFDPNAMVCIPQSLPPRDAKTSSGNQKRTAMSCTMGQYIFIVKEINDRCNGTPYWAMEVPTELIPDHTTIFTDRLITFLRSFISTTAMAPTAPKLCRPEIESP